VPLHQDRDVSFESPPEWVDRSIVGHAAPTNDGAQGTAPNFLMTREVMRERESLRTHVDRQTLELVRRLKDFDLLESSDAVLGGLPAIHLRYSWSSYLGPLEQSLTVVERIAENVRVATSFTATASAEDASKMKGMFAELLKTVRFGQPISAAPRPPLDRPSEPPTDAEALVIPMPGRRRAYR
jgi:hypothetical protein